MKNSISDLAMVKLCEGVVRRLTLFFQLGPLSAEDFWLNLAPKIRFELLGNS